MSAAKELLTEISRILTDAASVEDMRQKLYAAERDAEYWQSRAEKLGIETSRLTRTVDGYTELHVRVQNDLLGDSRDKSRIVREVVAQLTSHVAALPAYSKT